jgi:alkanesulfonate monooxygenase SsuD/methylene tetrahydromethanopterin reductase-like flavin-dependent oxidoreductase (luciferase family)
MRYSIDTPQFGPYSDPRVLAQLAREAEDAGWDGFFIWDHIQVGWQDTVADPWIALAAMAAATERIRLGALVTPLHRRTPWKVARECASLDVLSEGRLVFGAGLGTDLFGEISKFHYPPDDKVRAEMTDEALAILTGLWSGEPFAFKGRHYQLEQTTFLPKPVQQPRIPIWVAGTWPKKPPLRRAARYDAVVPVGGNIELSLTPDEVRAILEYIRRHRTSDAPFDFVQAGVTRGADRSEDCDVVAPYIDAGATWWNETILPWKRGFDEARARIRSGPPRR